MAQAAARKPTKADNERRALAHELVGIHRKHRTDLERADGIKAELKKIATDDGQNFQEMFAGEGVVKVAGEKSSRFKGTVPTVNIEKLNALPPSRRKKLFDDGILVMTDEYTGAYYGRVTVDLF